MNADELEVVFHHDGFELTGYKGPDGTVYNLTELNKLSELFDDGQLHAGKTTIYTAQWERIGDKTGDSSAYYTKAEDGTVKIESVDQNELKKQLETDSTVQIDVAGLEAEKVTLPVSAVNDVLDLEAETLSIKTANAAVSLDKTAMQSVVKTADGNDIQLHVSTGDALNEGQTAIIGDIEQGMVLDVSLTANGTEIHSFDGEVTVSVPFDWTKQGVLQAWYLADDGKKEPVEVAYRDGTAVLMLEHFSTYAIVVVTAADAKSPVIDKDSVTLSRTTAAAGDTVEVTVKVTDNVAVSRVAIDFWNNDTGDQLHLWMSRVGDSDIFSAQFEVTKNTPAGMWRVFEISANDTTENCSSIYFSHNENNFFVQSEVPPITVSVDNISIDKKTATVGETVTISIKFDNDRVNRVSLSLSNRDSGRQDHFLDMTYDEETKSYVYRFVVDDTVPSGYWEIGFINVNDAYGYGGAEYIGSSKAGFTVTGTSADAKAPVIDNSTLTVSKSEIDGGESSVISVRITDNVGVDRVVFSIANEETGKILAYPAMHYNETSGKYEYTFTADETIPSGHWRVWTIHAEDSAENLDIQSYRWECYILVKGENEHVWKTDKAVEATCTRTGLTEGESCEICGKVKTPQQVVEMKPHSYTDRCSYRLASKATCTEAAKYYVQCDNCFTVSDTLTVPYGNVLGHKFSSSEPYCLNGCGMKNPDYRLNSTPSGKPNVKPAPDELETAKNPFTDVAASDYFYDAVVWAANQGIALGDSATTFRPNGICARAEIVTFLWRAAGSPEPAGTSISFLDVPENAYYYKAVLWAAENGIVKGTTETEFGANAVCTRAQVVTFLYRYAGTNATAKDNPFTDVNMDAYYYDAVAWTAAEGITAGTSAATFSPNDSCTRGQIVTFLYRTYNR